MWTHYGDHYGAITVTVYFTHLPGNPNYRIMAPGVPDQNFRESCLLWGVGIAT